MRFFAFHSRHRIVLALILLLLSIPAWATDWQEDRATLKGVDSFAVVVEAVVPDAGRGGLTQSQLTTDIDSRLRQEGISVNPASPFMLHVVVSTVQSDSGHYAYNVTVTFRQAIMLMRDPKISQAFAPTWSVTSIGIVSAARLPDVRPVVIDAVDWFIKAYLEQNPKR